jgi:hypothetical protein
MSARFARQVSLAEIGVWGQQRIEATRVRAGHGDPRAQATGVEYVTRAGGRVDEDGSPLDVPDAAELAAIAGRPELIEAAAFLAGSLAATHVIARAVGLDVRPCTIPSLSNDDR